MNNEKKKTKQFLSYLVCMIMLLLGLSSCNDNYEPTHVSINPDTVGAYSAKINLRGELDSTYNNPLVNAGNDLYGVQVDLLDSITGFYYSYACGLFDNPDKIIVKLQKGRVYSFKCILIKNGKNIIYHNNNSYAFPLLTHYIDIDKDLNTKLTNDFYYCNSRINKNDVEYMDFDSSTGAKLSDNESVSSPQLTRIYGELYGFVFANNNINLNMKDCSFTVKYTAQNIDYGTLKVWVDDRYSRQYLKIDSPDTTAEGTFAFDDDCGTIFNDKYYSKGIVTTVEWKKSATDSIVISKYLVYERNKLNTFRIVAKGYKNIIIQ
jgi:hypothetical protein